MASQTYVAYMFEHLYKSVCTLESGWGANGFIILILKSINIIRLLWLQAELWYQLLADTTEKE